MVDSAYFTYFVTNIQGAQFSCFTQSGEKKEYDGTLSAKQGYVLFTDESTTNGVHKYRITNNGSFNGDNGDYSKWKVLPTYTLPNGAVVGNTYEHIVTGSNNVMLSDYHGVKVYGSPQVIYNWNIKTVKTITIRVSVSTIGYNHNGKVAFKYTVSGDVNGTANNTLANDVLRSKSISLSWGAVTPAGPLGNYTTSITSTGLSNLETGENYVTGTKYYIDMGNPPSCSPSSGTYNDEYNWDTNVTTRTN